MAQARTLDPDHDLYDFAAVELHRQRKVRNLSLDAVGVIIQRDRSLVARIESGHTKMSLGHAENLDRAWNLGRLFTRLIGYAKTRHNTEWVVTRYELEARVTHLKVWALSWVPGLWQTEDYARAAFEAARLDDVETQVGKRMRRQAILDRTPAPIVRLYLDQGVIDQPVGGPAVMRAQLARLTQLAELQAVRIVPRSVGAHPGRDGAFWIMTVDGADVAYTETIGPGRLIEDPTEVRSYGVWFDRIGDVALSPQESLRLIRETMENLE